METFLHTGRLLVQYSTVQYSTVQYSTVQYSTVQYSTVQYSTVQYSTVQYSTVLVRVPPKFQLTFPSKTGQTGRRKVSEASGANREEEEKIYSIFFFLAIGAGWVALVHDVHPSVIFKVSHPNPSLRPVTVTLPPWMSAQQEMMMPALSISTMIRI
jgi:hypothetical protein